ncbi:MAG: 1,4-dihydroxy-6-naphthoate synthase [Bacteroidales bacterium]|nr:1,4-dihydroxy-6-naphthoate synthase [Bacteroidales bacterium]
MQIKIAISPCPNDVFIFYALINKKIEIEGVKLDFVFFDIEQLNKMAIKAEPDICKLSFHAFAYCANNYALLDAGNALGNNCGPIVISKRKIYPDELYDAKIAIPGKLTTANLLLKIAFPSITNKEEFVFSDIETAVLDEQCDAGLIIHENRFTYEKKGLKKVIDLGEWWENEFKQPIPLGGIAIKRDIPIYTIKNIEKSIRESIDYAKNNIDEALIFCKKYAQEMNEVVMMQHINLYVNNYTYSLQEKGQAAIKFMFQKAIESNIFNNSTFNIESIFT